jgi:hypothetical protein
VVAHGVRTEVAKRTHDDREIWRPKGSEVAPDERVIWWAKGPAIKVSVAPGRVIR